MTISKSYPAVSRFFGAAFMLTLPWAAAAQTIDDARTSTVSSSGGDAEITVTGSGSITTSGILQHGINSTGESPTIVNNGTITTDGGSARGIKSTVDSSAQDKTTITNNGTITTNDSTSDGILADGDEAIITNNGTITTSGERSTGIRSTGDDAEIILGENGTITTSGERSAGIRSTHENAMITINGSIITTDEGGHGVQSINLPSDDGVPDNAIITVGATGSITTEGRGAHGIFSEGADATITNDGTITTTGDGAHGIQAVGEDAEITINGTVIVSGEGAYVVHGGDDTNQILTLSAGAETQGEFNLGDSEGDNDVANVSLDTSTVISSTITIGGAETINLTNADQDARILQLPQFKSESGDSVAIVDPTGATATRRALGRTTGQIHRQVSNRLAFAPHVGDSAADAHDGAAWGALFGGQSKRDDDGLALAFDHSFYGVVGGYDAYSDSGQRGGFFVGFGREDIKTSDIASITDTADRLFAGFYGRHVMGNWSLDGSVMLGRASHKSTRLVDDNIKGRETARGKYNSTTISPALRLSWSHALASGLELRPSAHIAYTHGSYGSYTESGTTNSDISFGKRTVGITDARLQLAVAQPFAADRGEIEWRIGATSTHYGKDSVNARLGDEGATTSYTVPGDRTVSGGFVGATLHYAIKDRVNLDGTIEYTETSGDRSGALSGQLGLVFKF